MVAESHQDVNANTTKTGLKKPLAHQKRIKSKEEAPKTAKPKAGPSCADPGGDPPAATLLLDCPEPLGAVKRSLASH
jgi:hypothetical protein